MLKVPLCYHVSGAVPVIQGFVHRFIKLHFLHWVKCSVDSAHIGVPPLDLKVVTLSSRIHYADL